MPFSTVFLRKMIGGSLGMFRLPFPPLYRPRSSPNPFKEAALDELYQEIQEVLRRKYKSVIEATRRINTDRPNIILSDWSDGVIRHFGDCARWRAVLSISRLGRDKYSGKLNSVLQPMLALLLAVR